MINVDFMKGVALSAVSVLVLNAGIVKWAEMSGIKEKIGWSK